MAKLNNLAYDYSAYNEQEYSEKIKHRQNTVLKNKKHTTLRLVGLAIAMLALMCSMIYGRVELSSLYSQQTNMQAELNQLTNENISLESELASKTGLTKVEEYAENELGLKKLDKSQIEYVEVETETVAEVVNEDDSNLFVKIKRWFTDVLEYIGL